MDGIVSCDIFRRIQNILQKKEYFTYGKSKMLKESTSNQLTMFSPPASGRRVLRCEFFKYIYLPDEIRPAIFLRALCDLRGDVFTFSLPLDEIQS